MYQMVTAGSSWSQLALSGHTFYHPQSFDVNKNEFLCPLCRCLSNTVIPILPQFHVLQQPVLAVVGEEATGRGVPCPLLVGCLLQVTLISKINLI